MEKGFGQADPAMIQYANETFHPEDEILKKARQTAEVAKLPAIQVGAFDALHLEVLARMAGAKKAVEIGTLYGYSGIALARALGKGGALHTFEYDPRHADLASRNFAGASLEASVKVHVGPALENLPKIASEGPFDLVFIDADKINYPRYLGWALENLRVGGVAIGDNTFAWGDIHRASELPPTRAADIGGIREFNKMVAENPRWRATILPTAEGMTVAVKVS